jgi:type IV secretion system protein VirB6
VYTLFLMALARVALALLLAIGPLFIVLLLFESTQRFFEAWIAQLVNYALVGVLAVLTASLMLTVVEAYATQTAALGAAILTVDALDMLLVAGLVLLLLRQVMPIAARLAGGVTLASFGTLSAVLARGAGVMQRGGARAAGGLVAGVAERLPGLRASTAASVQTLTPTVSAGRVAPVWRGVRGG